MKIPGTVFIQSLEVSEEHMEYCTFINSIIRKMALTKGVKQPIKDFSGDFYAYEDANVRLYYTDSAYGNDGYQVEVHCAAWNAIPPNVNPAIVNDGGPWNFVYHFHDGQQVLLFHIPGDWLSVLSRYG